MTSTHSVTAGFAVILAGSADVASTPAVEVALRTADTDEVADDVVLAALVVVDRVVLDTADVLPELAEVAG